MKNNSCDFVKKIKGVRLVALTLIVCMGLADISLVMNYGLVAGYESEDHNETDNVRVITENHALEVALADGTFDGRNSDSPSVDSDTIEIEVEAEAGPPMFNILEIYPTEKRGVVGYLIGGHEPFDVEEIKDGDEVIATKAEMKQAYMDALVNSHPGYGGKSGWNNNTHKSFTTYGDDHNLLDRGIAWYLKQGLQGAFKDSTGSYPFVFEADDTPEEEITYHGSGYYKYVGDNKGVYRIENFDSATPDIYSRFYETGGRTDYNYIFVFNLTSPRPVDKNVTNHRHIKYINNEMFIKNCLGKTGEDVQKFKDEHQIEVTTRTPRSVTLEDIEKADIIFIDNADSSTMRYFTYALNIQNKINGKNENLDADLHFFNPENDGWDTPIDQRIDFSDITDSNGNVITPGFEKVIRIYERIVVRQDAAIIAEENVCPNGTNNVFNTNIRKLMCMLFYVKKGGRYYEGRDLFADYLKRYSSQPGEEYLNLRKMHLIDPANYPVDYRSTSVKRNTKDQHLTPNDPGYYFSHVHADFHVGHPLVLDPEKAVTGVDFDYVYDSNGNTVPIPKIDSNGNVITVSNPDERHRLTLKRWEPDMYQDAGFKPRPEDPYNYDPDLYDPNGYYEVKYGDTPVYCYDYAYESMSNTTDFIYIDDYGRLIIDAKFSSDQNENDDYKNYWYRIDADGEVDYPYAFRRRKWSADTYDLGEAWPWDSELKVWLMHRQSEGPVCYDCNMHMWYDYNVLVPGNEYSGFVDGVPKSRGTGGRCDNECILQANELFKTTTENWIYNALEKRTIKREMSDNSHKVNKVSKDYYVSMNILNGDGVNKNAPDASKKNKTIYYNEYEEKKITDAEAGGIAYIPIDISIKSSCKLKDIKVTGGGRTITYPLNLTITDQDQIITENGIGSRADISTSKLTLDRPADSVDAEGNPTDKTPQGNLIHTFEGKIYDVLYDWYRGKRNTSITVELTVILPDDVTEKTISDEITIVRRDFFMLD